MLLFLMSAIWLTGCGKKENSEDRTIEFVVCSEDEIPLEFKSLIEEKKQHSFAMSFLSGEDMYVAVGYGAHDRRDLNVVVKDFYITDHAAYLDTTLVTAKETPSDGDAAGESSMYPYIVIKCERFDAPIYYNAP